MGLLSTLLSKVFHTKAPSPTPPPAAASSPEPTSFQATTTPTTTAGPAASNTPPPPPTPPAPVPVIDVGAHLDELAAQNPEKLDWKRSIVDLMKLLDMDSSLSARKELAEDLNYSGDTNDSASMNIWLHKQVIQKIAANGGKLPPELLA